ncbi:MAG: DivIVA domain-containing protein [Nitrospinae bacterium]|nr:DivIVA domain-containing protein [Nitrospinota bacterium]
MKISPIDVRQQQFKLKFRGFDVEEVDNYLELIANELEELNRENESLKNELRKREQELGECKNDVNDFKKMFAAVQDFRNEAFEKANRESQLIIKQAEMKASEILKEAEERRLAIEKEIAELKVQTMQFDVQFRTILENYLKLLDSARNEKVQAGEKR